MWEIVSDGLFFSCSLNLKHVRFLQWSPHKYLSVNPAKCQHEWLYYLHPELYYLEGKRSEICHDDCLF